MSGVPEKLEDEDGVETEDADKKALCILQSVNGDIENNDFKVLHSFSVFTNTKGKKCHSIKVCFHNKEKKDSIMEKKVSLNSLEDDHPLKTVYIKNDQPPLTNKENNRLRDKARTIKNNNPNDTIKIDKGKLYHNNNVVDSFNLANQIF